MDIRLLMDGGASPQAPPGRIAESPPPKEEFEKTLQRAKKEETPGEVAENEPNAQLQKLDSEKKETGTKQPANDPSVPIQIDPAILAQLQLVGISQLPATDSASQGYAFDPNTDQKPVVKQLENKNPILGVPLGIPVDLKSSDLPVTATLSSQIQGLSQSKPQAQSDVQVQAEAPSIQSLDSITNETLSAMIAKSFDGKTVKSLDGVRMAINPPIEQSAKPLKLDPTIQPIKLVSTEAGAKLNVTSVQSTSSQLTDQLVATGQMNAKLIPLAKPSEAQANSEAETTNIGDVQTKPETASKIDTDKSSIDLTGEKAVTPTQISAEPKPQQNVAEQVTPQMQSAVNSQAQLNTSAGTKAVEAAQAKTDAEASASRPVQVTNELKPAKEAGAGKLDRTNTSPNQAVTSKLSADSFEQSLAGNGQGKDSKDQGNATPQTVITELQTKTDSTGQVAATSKGAGYQLTTVERQAMVETISRKIDELAVKSVRNEVRVEMHPPDLGSVVVNIRRDLTGLTATLNASNEPLRQALHESRNDLAGALTDRNVGQVRIEVKGANADTMNMGQQFDQAQSEQQNQQRHSRQAPQNHSQAVVTIKETIEKPMPRRAVTTLLDMEI